MKTIDGTVHAIASEAEEETRFRPVENKFPGVECFPVAEIEVLERITQIVFRVKIRGHEYCLKAGDENLVRAVEKLRRAGKMPNVLCLQGLAVDKNSRVIGIITAFVPGKLLILVRSATSWEKRSWKEQISTAVRSLHENGILWGDAKPHNIVISNVSGEAVLIDLDGGATDDWVNEALCDTKEGDLQALEHILRFIDALPNPVS